jgi:hypothetical protein
MISLGRPSFFVNAVKCFCNRIEHKFRPENVLSHKVALAIFKNIGDIIVTDAIFFTVILKPGEFVGFPVQQVQSTIKSAYPQVIIPVFQQGSIPCRC